MGGYHTGGAPVQSLFFETEPGIKLAYVVLKSNGGLTIPGRLPLVLIQGLTGVKEDWIVGGFLETLNNDRTILVFDNRGIGESTVPKVCDMPRYIGQLKRKRADQVDDAGLCARCAQAGAARWLRAIPLDGHLHGWHDRTARRTPGAAQYGHTSGPWLHLARRYFFFTATATPDLPLFFYFFFPQDEARLRRRSASSTPCSTAATCPVNPSRLKTSRPWSRR